MDANMFTRIWSGCASYPQEVIAAANSSALQVMPSAQGVAYTTHQMCWQAVAIE